MTAYLADPSVQVIAPLIAILVYAIWGRYTLIGSAIVAVALLYLFDRGVARTCLINESECIGATAFFYIIAILWAIVAISVAGHAIYKKTMRSK